MSQIDQAFIQAYAMGEPQVEPAAGFAAGPAGGPAAPALPPQQAIPPYAPGPAAQHYQAPAQQPLAVPAAVHPPAQATVPVGPAPPPAPQFQPQMPPEPRSEFSQRRPLSSFSAPPEPPTHAFQPVSAVEAFCWPEVVDALLRDHHHLWDPVLQQLLDDHASGKTLVGIAGARPGVGCTSVSLCLARLLAEAGLQVAVVDANFPVGNLAAQLLPPTRSRGGQSRGGQAHFFGGGADVDNSSDRAEKMSQTPGGHQPAKCAAVPEVVCATGWEDALAGAVPLAEAVLHSIRDGVSLLPLRGPVVQAAELLAGIQTSIIAGVLRYHYDMVLFDLGAAAEPSQYRAAQLLLQHCRWDTSFIATDMASCAGGKTTPSMGVLQGLLGATCQGWIGNGVVAGGGDVAETRYADAQHPLRATFGVARRSRRLPLAGRPWAFRRSRGI